MKRFHVKMLKDQRGQDLQDNGVTAPSYVYQKERVYAVGMQLACDLLEMEVCELVEKVPGKEKGEMVEQVDPRVWRKKLEEDRVRKQEAEKAAQEQESEGEEKAKEPTTPEHVQDVTDADSEDETEEVDDEEEVEDDEEEVEDDDEEKE